MSYRLISPHTLDRDLKRVVQDCIDNALAQLDHKGKKLHEGIHETRKQIKEIRAVLKLIRTEPGFDYAEENAWFRKQANSLSALRDAKAMLEVCDALSITFAGQLDHDPFSALHTRLNNRLAVVVAEHPQLNHELSALQKAFKHARSRVLAWPLKDRGFGTIEDGLLKSYRKGRTAYRQCRSNPDEADFHVWRKRVKEHYYHISLLLSAWTGELEGRQHSLKQLSDLLGDDHDLLVLEQQVNSAPKDFGTGGEVEHLLDLIYRRRQQVQSSALSIGARLYAENPLAHIKRLAAYWACWDEESAKG